MKNLFRKNFLIFLLSCISYVSFAYNSDIIIKSNNISGTILYGTNKTAQFKSVDKDTILHIGDQLIVGNNSKVTLNYKCESCHSTSKDTLICTIDIPSNNIIILEDTCEKIKNKIKNDTPIVDKFDENIIKTVVITTSIIGIGAIVYHHYHNKNNDDNISLE